MTAAYFDSSALVKLVIEEDGSEDAALLWDGADSALTSRVAHPEVRAALAAAHRDGRVTDRALDRAKADWEDLRAGTWLVELSPEVETNAGQLAEEHSLSGFDAVHLASVVAISDLPVVVATWDRRLREAAQAVGFPTLP